MRPMFQTLVLSLPTRNSTLRMRVWRALKECGAAVLRDGVYLLPQAEAFDKLEKLQHQPHISSNEWSTKFFPELDLKRQSIL